MRFKLKPEARAEYMGEMCLSRTRFVLSAREGRTVTYIYATRGELEELARLIEEALGDGEA